MAMRNNEINLTRHELRRVFEGKSITDVGALIAAQFSALTARGWTPERARRMINIAVETTNRPLMN